ncbi:MAG: hypothetical protein DRO11_10370 [Methanobacteriota archaeon]|nr:MAG: hypothetical protein DRO11_10370 [Euryarchaeota archaeon]
MKKQFKFFKPIYSEKHKPKLHPKVVGATATLLTLSMLIALVTFQGSPVMNMKADPVVWQHILTGSGGLYITVAYSGSIKIEGLDIIKQWKFGDLRVAFAYAKSSDALEKLVNLDNVIRVCAWGRIDLPPFDYVVKNEEVTYDFLKDYKRIYHRANQRWTGEGITVAVIDTGIDYLHPDFYRNGTTIIKVLVSTIYKENGTPIAVRTEGYTREQMEDVLDYELSIRDAVGSEDYVFEDAFGHGTHVAGIIAGQGIASDCRYVGIAPDVNLVIIKAFFDDGYATEETILDALQWIYDHAEEYNIKVLSCSFGSPPASPLPNPTELAMRELIEDKGIVIFCAGGNAGTFPSTIISPARDPYVFAVGAIDPYTDKLAVFSSIGDPVTPPFNSPEKTKPDFVGAGVNIIAPASSFAQFPDYAVIHGRGGDYVIMSGTSMATPSVSSTFACFYQYWIEKHGRPPTKQDFINYVRQRGIVYNPLGKDFLTGWGAPAVPPPN